MIKQLAAEDLEEYLLLLQKFHLKSTIHSYADFDYSSCKTFLLSCLENPDISVLCYKKDNKVVGIAGGLLFPLYFNHNYKVVQELWWWVEEEYRGSECATEMYKALEQWANDKQANGMFMIALEDSNVEKMVKVYKRKGFVGTERTFIKELNNGN
jgi:RimJ/RimL family protein N-acetyltransferase